MKRIIIATFLIGLFAGFSSCEKVEEPIKTGPAGLDPDIYPGNFALYEVPTFTANTNTDRNVIIEDYTGHKCPNCPAAATMAADIEDANPGRVFVSSVHAGPGGIGGFQKLSSSCESDPNAQFCDKLYCDESEAYGIEFQTGFGFIGNPMGTINRYSPDGASMFEFANGWQERTEELLTENNLQVNIQAKSNYFSETNGFYLHTEVEFLHDLSEGNYNIVVALHENEFIGYQDSMGVYLDDYHHHNVLRGCLDGGAFGLSLNGAYTEGSKIYNDYSYQFSYGTNEDYHLLIYVYDVDTYEILQVIKHEI